MRRGHVLLISCASVGHLLERRGFKSRMKLVLFLRPSWLALENSRRDYHRAWEEFAKARFAANIK